MFSCNLTEAALLTCIHYNIFWLLPITKLLTVTLNQHPLSLHKLTTTRSKSHTSYELNIDISFNDALL